MKQLIILISILFFTSCVSSKKYRILEDQLQSVKSELSENKLHLAVCNDEKTKCSQKAEILMTENLTKDISIKMLEQDKIQKAEKIKNQEENISYLKSSNKILNERVDALTGSAKVNADIMKKLLEDLENQNLKVLNLSLALEKQDSTNISSVKKTKKNMSDEKLRKSLEKLGFVFY
ncbi:MAG: hypothetical protein IPM42_14410 [Saprospiraceae bacterium]|nr:hypothetical protein [Saprospiraceae bacterium]